MNRVKKLKNMKKVWGMTMVTSVVLTAGLTLEAPLHVSANDNDEQAITYSSTQKRNVMYYGDWSIWGGQGNFYPKDIPADQLTHLNFSFLDFDGAGNLIFTDEDAAVGAPVGQSGVQWGAPNAGILIALQELREQNPNLKIGVSIGGWSKSADFPTISKDNQKRANFVENVMKFLEYTNMDFVDIDWEFAGEVRQPDLIDNQNDEGNPYASAQDKEYYINLLEDLRVGCDELGQKLGKKIELSVALPAPKKKVDVGIDVKRLFDLVDFANIMSYDMRGAWDEYSGHQTGLYANPLEPLAGNNLSIDESVQYLIDQGAEPQKIVIGAAYYTRGWNQVKKGPDASLPGLFGEASVSTKDADQTPSRGAINEAPLKAGDGGRMSGVWSYNAISKLKSQYPGLKEYWDDTAKAPYLYDEATGLFFTYDNVKSIQEKTKYVDEQNLGGMIAWMASNDAKTNSNKRDELTKATKEGLYGNKSLPEFEIVHSELDVSVSMTPYEEAWGANPKGYMITLKNNEVLEESNQVLKAVEKGSETIKAPKLYLKTEKPLVSGDYTAGTVKYENGYTVVDLQSVWEGKNIEPGQTYQFKLKGEAEIESIKLVQRMSADGPEMYSQVIYGEGLDEETPEVNTAPIFKGVHTKTLTVGDTFDILEGVTATDKEDGDLTASITVVGEVNTLVAGEYVLTYSVTDSKNLTTTKERVIKVVEKDIEQPDENRAPVLQGVEDKTILVGDTLDLLAGITATDEEDGDLTSAIKWIGDVNTQVPGKYVVTYSVADSKNLETIKERLITVKEKAVVDVDFGVGQGIEWPKQVNAPYIDMVSWITKPGYTNNGAPNLAKISEDTGVTFFNLGFIQSLGSIKDNKVEWGWGGHRVLGETGTMDTQYEGIKKSIIDIRELGGDVTISIGGLNGVTPWQVTQDVEILTNTYLEIVKGYGLTRLDLDIEGSAQNKAYNIANAKAIKNVQDQTNVKIVLTLPVLPSGLTSIQLDVLEAYLSQGVDVHLVNLMTMCYGESPLLPGENYGTGSLRAVDSTKDQIKQYYKQFSSIELSDEQAYAKIGTTPSIGFEGAAHPIFTLEWAQLIVDHATSRGLGMTSFWSMNRDAVLESNQGINQPYEFTTIFKTFAQDSSVGPEQNSAPLIEGVSDVTLTVGDEFNVLSGVKALDKEDGDLSAFITVQGSVDLNTPGVYYIIYTVSDSEGLTTSKERVITVVKKENKAPQLTGVDDVTISIGEAFDVFAGVAAVDDEDGDLTSSIQVVGEVFVEVAGAYTLVYSVTDSQNVTVTKTRVVTVKDPLSDTYEVTKVYLQGDKVIYNGHVYTAKWWVQGEAPDTSAAWEKEVKPNEDGSVNYESGMIFVGGELVNYNGYLYESKWWTNSIPGSDDSWKLIK